MTNLQDIQMTIGGLDDKGLKRLMALLPMAEITTMREPRTGLVMMAVQDAFGTDFHLGEVLATEAEVDYRGVRGYALLIGDAPERALAAAAVEAVLKDNDAARTRPLTRFLETQQQKQSRSRERERCMVGATRVRFETMPAG